MKEGWQYIALSSVCEVQNGFAFNSKLFNESNNGLPLIRIRDIKRGYSLTYTDETCSDEFFVEDGDMLIGMDGDFNIGEWKGGHALLNQRVCKLIPSENILAKFIFYFIPEALQKINDKTAFSTVKHLSSKQVNAILLPNLPLSEQQSIVDYLDSAFAKIDAMKANAEKALNEAKALFQASLKEMLEPREGWEEKKLSDITEVKDGTHDSPKYVPEGIPFVTQKNITNNGFDLVNTKKITIEDHNKFYTRSNVEYGDIIISMIGANRGMSCIVDTRDTFSIKNVGLIKKSGNINTMYLLFYLHSPAAYSYVLDKSNGGAQEFIGLKGLRNFPIPYPPLSEQQSIVATLDSLKSKVDRLQENYDKISQECDALKQAILRQVFE
ncbi:MAG: restriction endonuclease subunit S [Prevotella sp.]|nr:restriction endonuclease subunit S [Paludibacteraceae bacterium]MBR4389027.1 restriction endonuclease subunit S [Prevotella sp.]